MDVVALLALSTAVEVEAPLLAADLGVTAYEAALLLRAPSPVPLLRTADRPRALGLLARLRGRGHDAVACDASAVVSTEAMLHMRSFRLEPDALELSSEAGALERLPWSDVIAMVRAVHRTRSEHVEQSTARKIDLGRAALSGGLMLTRKVTTTTTSASEDREQILYVFRKRGTPVLVQQSRTRYEGLAADLRPSQLENFATLVRLLRARCPDAAFDERLLAPRPAGERIRAGANGSASASSSDSVDLLAHLVALAITRAS